MKTDLLILDRKIPSDITPKIQQKNIIDSKELNL